MPLHCIFSTAAGRVKNSGFLTHLRLYRLLMVEHVSAHALVALTEMGRSTGLRRRPVLLAAYG